MYGGMQATGKIIKRYVTEGVLGKKVQHLGQLYRDLVWQYNGYQHHYWVFTVRRVR